ncbi:hypothetical protein [Methylobacter sp.]|uniref:hypothetical protein n=1 Tax=Methylobacter sp. TaxID=2051955 RepID=UPI001214196F|nr:hypothetical protein [Methylobacter sp.]TAK62414.1 MAG: hypothetical protein EPO18_10665 [Methylobacter sp.]
MISEQAQSGFDHIFKKAVLGNISSSADDNCEIEPVDDLEEVNENEFVVLTISSAFFRFLTLFHFDSDDDATKNYFLRNSNLEVEDNSAFLDAFQEVCNICCGVMNRELHKSYLFLGMSTPYILLRQCVPFVSALNPGYVKHYKITINHSLVLHATLCICDYDIVDFTVNTSADEDSTGELELF